MREVAVVKIAGVEGVVVGGGSDAVQHHVPHRQHIGIPNEQDVADVPIAPRREQVALQLFGVVHARARPQDRLQRDESGRKLRFLVVHVDGKRGVERPRRDDQQSFRLRRLLAARRSVDRDGHC